MSSWMVPVYREGYTDPFFPFAMDPWSALSAGGRGDRFGPMRHMEQTMRDLGMFPWREPGTLDVTPSQLAPREDQKTYRIEVAAQEFKPNEITVKTVEREGKQFLVCEGKHETRDESGFHSVHHFKRQYMLPSNVKGEDFTASLGKDGKLCIEAPKIPEKQALEPKEKNIAIEQKK